MMELSDWNKRLIADAISSSMRAHVDGIPEGYWVTAKRETIRISDMSNGHLANTMNMLRRKGLNEHGKFKELEQEARNRNWTIHEDEFLLEGGL